MVLSQTMGAASRKVRCLKPSAFEIARCCWENKQENTVVPFQQDMFVCCFLRSVLLWWAGSPGEVEPSRAGTIIPLQTAFPQGSRGSVQQNLCSYGKLRHSKASIPTKCLWLCWHSTGRVLDIWMLELRFFLLRDHPRDSLGEAAEVCSSSAFTAPWCYLCVWGAGSICLRNRTNVQPWCVCLALGWWFCAWGAGLQP